MELIDLFLALRGRVNRIDYNQSIDNSLNMENKSICKENITISFKTQPYIIINSKDSVYDVFVDDGKQEKTIKANSVDIVGDYLFFTSSGESKYESNRNGMLVPIKASNLLIFNEILREQES